MRAEDVPAAASLAAARVRRARSRCPLLPERWTDADACGALLSEIVRRGVGMVALADEHLVGYLAAWPGEGRGDRWAYVPEIGWGVDGSDDLANSRVIQDLYAGAAERWVAEDRRAHFIGVLAGEAEEAAFAWLGFGRTVMDGIRSVEPVAAPPVPGVGVRRGEAADAATIAELEDGLRAHLAGSPVFFALGEPRSADEQRRCLADPAVATFVAEASGRAVGYLRIGPASDDASTVIRDPGTASITGAFTRPDRRRAGVATGLLAAAVAWAGQNRYVRVAVDFETANLLASRFWTREFTPVTFSLGRRV
jgi:GNAT superfamily N-acetyltransferase